jgi:hypothetical protein
LGDDRKIAAQLIIPQNSLITKTKSGQNIPESKNLDNFVFIVRFLGFSRHWKDCLQGHGQDYFGMKTLKFLKL